MRREWPVALDVLVLVLAFLIGSLPFSWAIGRFRYGVDLREEGDRNAGSGNLWTLCGLRPGIAALVLDILKGVAAVGIAFAFDRAEGVVIAAAVAAVLGHVFPPWLSFHGGRGAAAAIGAAAALLPGPGGAFLAVGLALVVLTRNTVLSIAVVMPGVVLVSLVAGGDGSRIAFLVALFIAVGLKDAWDRLQRRRHAAAPARAG